MLFKPKIELKLRFDPSNCQYFFINCEKQSISYYWIAGLVHTSANLLLLGWMKVGNHSFVRWTLLVPSECTCFSIWFYEHSIKEQNFHFVHWVIIFSGICLMLGFLCPTIMWCSIKGICKGLCRWWHCWWILIWCLWVNVQTWYGTYHLTILGGWN